MPTLCRPRHLDPERLRARLGAEKFERLRYHEAAVVSTAPLQFQVFALSSDTLSIVPLLGRGEAAPEMCFSLRNITHLERVVPANKKQRGLLLVPTSQLFRIKFREVTTKKTQTELYFSTFEPHTQLFFQLSRALCVDFQKQLIPQVQATDNTPTQIEQRLELTNLLQTLALDLGGARDDVERTHLVDELTAAAYASDELRQLFFEDRTQIQGCTGVVDFLVRQLSYPLCQSASVTTRLTFVHSIARVLSAMCFDMQLRTSCVEMLLLNELLPNLLARGMESYVIGDKTIRVEREDFMDAQAALLLALDAMQQYEDFRLHQHQQMRGLLIERSTSVMQQALRAPALAEWLPTFFKRVCIAISRVAIAIERRCEFEDSEIEDREDNEESQEGRTDEEEGDLDCRDALDPSQMLALWRSVTVLELLVKCDVASGSNQVLVELLRTRKDYIDMYLRTPRFMTALRTSRIPHLEDIVLKMTRFLEALRDRRRR